MARAKRQELRDAILDAALDLFREQGYAQTTMAQIARDAGTSTGNTYVYFRAKLDVLRALYEPWLLEQMDRLQVAAAAEPDPRRRLALVLENLWELIPARDNGFAATWIEALAHAGSEEREAYSQDLLIAVEQRVAALIAGCLPASTHAPDGSDLAHLVFMAFDGFAVNHRLRGPDARRPGVTEMMITLLLGPVQPAPPGQGGVGPASDPTAPPPPIPTTALET